MSTKPEGRSKKKEMKVVDREMAEEIAAEFGASSDAVFDATEGLTPRKARHMVRRATERPEDTTETLERWAREDIGQLSHASETNRYARERKLGWAAEAPLARLLLREIDALYKRRIMAEYLLSLGRIPEKGFDATAELRERTRIEQAEGKLSMWDTDDHIELGVREQVKDAFGEIGLDALLGEAGVSALDDRFPARGPYSYEYYLQLLRAYRDATADLEERCRGKLAAMAPRGYDAPMGKPRGLDWTT